MLKAIQNHWPEYLMEAWGLGTFMVAACIGTAVLWHPDSPVEHWTGNNPTLQRLLMGIAMGLTAIGIVYSPWGKRSGAHINPALTLTFLRLGKIHFWDAVFYILFQFLGAIAGVALTWLVLGSAISLPQVNFAITVPGESGAFVAFVAEMLISAGIMGTVLFATNQPKLMNVTGILIGCLLVIYITFEAPGANNNNPDLWLLLHFSEIPGQQISQCLEIGQLIRAAVGKYNKTKVYNLPFTMENVELAIQRAKAAKPQGPILNELGSEAYLIIENLVASKTISITKR